MVKNLYYFTLSLVPFTQKLFVFRANIVWLHEKLISFTFCLIQND